jgi:hypothetical protein
MCAVAAVAMPPKQEIALSGLVDALGGEQAVVRLLKEILEAKAKQASEAAGGSSGTAGCAPAAVATTQTKGAGAMGGKTITEKTSRGKGSGAAARSNKKEEELPPAPAG